eukprot:8082710-Lingulodinium_polyedra.AAC.1
MAAGRLRSDKHGWLVARAAEVTRAFETGMTVPLWQLVRTFGGGRKARPTRTSPVLRDADGAVVSTADDAAALWERRFQLEFQGLA